MNSLLFEFTVIVTVSPIGSFSILLTVAKSKVCVRAA